MEKNVIYFSFEMQMLINGYSSNCRQIIVGSGKGKMNLVDLRNPAKVLNTYKGFVGSITGIACCKNEPYVVSVSLDRFLRIHHIDTKQLLKKVKVIIWQYEHVILKKSIFN